MVLVLVSAPPAERLSEHEADPVSQMGLWWVEELVRLSSAPEEPLAMASPVLESVGWSFPPSVEQWSPLLVVL